VRPACRASVCRASLAPHGLSWAVSATQAKGISPSGFVRRSGALRAWAPPSAAGRPLRRGRRPALQARLWACRAKPLFRDRGLGKSEGAAPLVLCCRTALWCHDAAVSPRCQGGPPGSHTHLADSRAGCLLRVRVHGVTYLAAVLLCACYLSCDAALHVMSVSTM